MAWYEVLVLWMLWCWECMQRCRRPFNDTSRDGRNEDDLTSLTDRMPVFEDKIIYTTVRYVNGEIMEYVVQTKYLDSRGSSAISDSYCKSVADTNPGDFYSNSISDQSTIAAEADAMTLNEPIAVCPSYIEGSTGKRMVDVFYKISLPLDDLEMRGKESRVPESGEDPIEALFHHGRKDLWVYVPYSYAEA